MAQRRISVEQDLWRALCALSAADRQAGAPAALRVAVAGVEKVEGVGFHLRCGDRRRHVSGGPHSGERRGGHARGSCSTCRCVSTPTISRSICPPSRPGRSRKSRWWRSGREFGPSSMSGRFKLLEHWINDPANGGCIVRLSSDVRAQEDPVGPPGCDTVS